MTAGRRDQLASVLRAEFGGSSPVPNRATDALLPVVDRMIRQAQADALESAADEFAEHEWSDWRGSDIAHDLRDRAAALRLTTDYLDVTQDAP